MSDAIKLLDKYRAACKPATDTEVARRLKVRASAVSNWRHGTAKPNAAAVEKMCAALGEPLRQWLPLIEAERARTPEDRKVWLRMAQAAAAIALALGLTAWQNDASARGFSRVIGQSVYYVKLWRQIKRLGMRIACAALDPARVNGRAIPMGV